MFKHLWGKYDDKAKYLAAYDRCDGKAEHTCKNRSQGSDVATVNSNGTGKSLIPLFSCPYLRYFPAHTKAAKARFSCGRSILSRKVYLLGREQVSRKFLGEQAFFDKPATPFLDT